MMCPSFAFSKLTLFAELMLIFRIQWLFFVTYSLQLSPIICKLITNSYLKTNKHYLISLTL